MASKLAESQPGKAVGIVVHQSEIKSGELDGTVLPKGLSASKEFRQDLNMGSAYWFYHQYGSNSQMQRVLLLQKSKDKDDAKDSDIKKSYRSLGATACAALQAKKLNDVELLVSSKVSQSNLGIFENSLHLSNYECVHKKAPENDETKEKDEDDDERTKKYLKKIDSIKVTTEDESHYEQADNEF